MYFFAEEMHILDKMFFQLRIINKELNELLINKKASYKDAFFICDRNFYL